MAKASQTAGGCLFLVVLVFIGFYLAGNSLDKRSDDEKQRRSALTLEQKTAEDTANKDAEEKRQEENQLEHRKAEAQTYSEDYVRKFLKHPNDASFGFWSVPSIKWNEGKDTFFVTSTVKAKNDFGAELTYEWSTILLLDENNWKLVSCKVGDDVVYIDEDIVNKLRDKKLRDEQAELLAEKKAKAEAKRQRQAEIEKSYWRTWTDAGGKHTTEAKYGGMSGGVVTLTKQDGTKMKIPIEKLSDSDQDWIKNHPR